MKKIVIMLVAIMVLLSVHAVGAAEGKPAYEIKQVASNMLQIIGNEEDHLYANPRIPSSTIPLDSGYGDALTNGLREVQKKFSIKQIIPVVYRTHRGHGSAGITRMLILIVEQSPRN
jgi:hypothetical protein